MVEMWAHIVIFVVVAAVLVMIYYRIGRQETEQELSAILARRKPLREAVALGQYVSGLDGLHGRPRLESRKIRCLITEESFVFLGFPEDSWQEVGEIARDALADVFVETARPFLPGSGSGEKAGEQGPRLVIDWHDGPRGRRRAVFEFTGPSALRQAHAAVGALKNYVRPWSSRKSKPRTTNGT